MSTSVYPPPNDPPLTVINGRAHKDIADRVCDMLLFSLAGGLVAGLAYMGSLQPEQCATLASVLVGAAAMYLKGK